MNMPGPFELLVIFFVVLILFGGKKLPEFGRALGEGIREFQKALKGENEKNQKQETEKQQKI